MEKAGIPFLLENPVLMNIGFKHSKTPAQVCLRWALQRKIGVIPKSSKPERLASDIDVYAFSFFSLI